MPQLTVKELMAELSKCDESALVYVPDMDEEAWATSVEQFEDEHGHVAVLIDYTMT